LILLSGETRCTRANSVRSLSIVFMLKRPNLTLAEK